MRNFVLVICVIAAVVIFGGVFLSNWNIPAPTKTVSKVIDNDRFEK